MEKIETVDEIIKRTQNLTDVEAGIEFKKFAEKRTLQKDKAFISTLFTISNKCPVCGNYLKPKMPCKNCGY